jgi:SAM-dependent methyltransferase
VQRNEIVQLSVPLRVLADPFPYILDYARGKRVLNVGASGGVEHYLPMQRESWLHHRLGKVAAELVGIDIDAESVSFAAQHGAHLLISDCETCSFPQTFDLIVMSDVIEHVNSPLRAIENLTKQLSPNGRLLITTPNPNHYGLVMRAWLGRRTDVYYDHVCEFLPEHFQVISHRLGLKLIDVVFFSHLDTRSFGNRLKSHLARLLGSLVPRCHGALMVALQPEKKS